MSKLTRITSILFGSGGPTDDFETFGSTALGSTDYSKDIAAIQATAAWLTGWRAALIASKAPVLQDMNGKMLVDSYQLSYLLQQGIAEYDASTTYFIGGVVTKAGTTEVYTSLVNTNVGNALGARVSNSNWQYCGMLQDILMRANYMRPELNWVDGTHVSIRPNNIFDVSTPTVLFRDGEIRAEGTTGLTTLNTGQVAALSGSKQSGLISGSVAANTWYSVFAAKATDNTTDWVTVAVPLDFVVANYSTFDGYFGVDGWVYLGSIRVGNNGNTGTGILKFAQSGDTFTFDNSLVIQSQSSCGMALASNGSAASLSWSYSAGPGAAQLPGNILIGSISFICVWGTTGTFAGGSGASGTIFRYAFSSNVVSAMNVPPINVAVGSGLNANAPAGSAIAFVLAGYVDSALAN